MGTQFKTSDEWVDELAQRYARFGLRPMTEDELFRLSLATMVLPIGHPGYHAYLVRVADADGCRRHLREWGLPVAAAFAKCKPLKPGGKYRRAIAEKYSDRWGRFAVDDAIELACLQSPRVPGIVARANQLGVGKQSYQLVRDLVGGVLVETWTEYQYALGWAWGYVRDRVFEARWETITGQNWDSRNTDATMGYPQRYPVLASGCHRTQPLKDMADAYEIPPETLYPAIGASQQWDEAYAARMAVECPAQTFTPRHGTLCPATDE